MLPDITDRTIDLLIQTPRMITAGQTYFRQGRVRNLRVDAEKGLVTAAVMGSELYTAEITFSGKSSVGYCSCPVAVGCKHVAAVLFALRIYLGKQTPGLFPVTTAQPLPVQPKLPPELTSWLGAMLPIARAERAAAVPDVGKAIFYVLRIKPVGGRPLPGAAKADGKAGEADLAGASKRITVLAYDVPLDELGRPRTVGSQLSLLRIYHDAKAIPAHAGPEDKLLLRRLGARNGEIDATECLHGRGGFDLLQQIIDTGRAYWRSSKGQRLRWGDAVSGIFTWRLDDQVQMRLTLQMEAAPQAMIAVLAPPLAIDPASGLICPIDTGVAPPVVEQLLHLPPVPQQAVAGLAARWSEIAPDIVPPPPEPDIRDLGRIVPTPVLSLLIDSVTMIDTKTRGYYSLRKIQSPWALARLSFDYGMVRTDATTTDETLLLRDGGDIVRLTRDLATEVAALERLDDISLFLLEEFEDVEPTDRQRWDQAPEPVAGPADFAQFLIDDAATLRAEGWRIEPSPEFPIVLDRIDGADFAIDIEPSGIDWFDLSLGAIVDGQRIDLIPLLTSVLKRLHPDQIERIVAGEDAEDANAMMLAVALPGGRIAPMEIMHVVPMLRALLMMAGNDPHSNGQIRVASHDLGTLAALDRTISGIAWHGVDSLRMLAGRLATLDFDPTPMPAGFDATLRPYQQTGLDWMQALAGAGFGGLLADDMGLGKTVQTIAHIMAQKAQGGLTGPVLILAPTSVLPNWQAEIARFAPALSTLLLYGPDRHGPMAGITDHDIVLTSYPLLVRDKERLAETRFGLIIHDEAHVLKNPRTASHVAARALQADRRIALTGTPVENRLTDAWSLIDLVVPGLLGPLAAFNRDYRNPIEKHGDPVARKRLARRLKPFMLRRTKDAVARDLPEKSLIPELVDLAPDQMALHESQRLLMHQRVQEEIARVGLMRAQIIILAALTRLRQICCDPRLIAAPGTKSPPSAKLDRLLEMLDELIPEGRRIILFSQFTSMLDLIKPELDKRDIAWVELTGKTKDRKTPVTRFQAGDIPLILVSLKAGGTGLNLTAADTVLLYDPWWNPAIEAQAIDRAHRIGQTRPVFVHRLIAKGTIEEKILALQARKSAIAETLWSEDAATPAQLTEDDIAFLLAG